MHWLGDVITAFAAAFPHILLLRLFQMLPSCIPLWDNTDALCTISMNDKMRFVCGKLNGVVSLPIVTNFSIF